MHRLSTERRCAVVSCHVEGMGVNAPVRRTGVSKPAILKLTEDPGAVAARFQDAALRERPCVRI